MVQHTIARATRQAQLQLSCRHDRQPDKSDSDSCKAFTPSSISHLRAQIHHPTVLTITDQHACHTILTIWNPREIHVQSVYRTAGEYRTKREPESHICHDSPESHQQAPLKGGTPHGLRTVKKFIQKRQPIPTIAIQNPSTIFTQLVHKTAGEYRTRWRGIRPHYHRLTPKRKVLTQKQSKRK